MAKSTELGMQTLDQSLVKAYKDGVISKEDALRYADSANDVRLQIKMLDKATPGARSGGDELGLSYDRPDPGRFIRR
jgi:twitching motility protein PilU